MNDVTIGIGGAAGDGIDKSSETLAKTSARSGLYAYGFNSYQSVIRGGHIWLRLRLREDKAYSCLLYTSPSPRDLSTSRMPSSA